MGDLDALTHHLEYLFLKTLISNLRSEAVSPQQARLEAQAFLTLQPFLSAEDTYIKIMNFVGVHEQFIALKHHMNAYQRERSDLAKIAKMREYMKGNDIAAAVAVART